MKVVFDFGSSEIFLLVVIVIAVYWFGRGALLIFLYDIFFIARRPSILSGLRRRPIIHFTARKVETETNSQRIFIHFFLGINALSPTIRKVGQIHLCSVDNTTRFGGSTVVTRSMIAATLEDKAPQQKTLFQQHLAASQWTLESVVGRLNRTAGCSSYVF